MSSGPPTGRARAVSLGCGALGLVLWASPLSESLLAVVGRKELLRGVLAELPREDPLRVAVDALLAEAAGLASEVDAISRAEKDRARLFVGTPRPLAPPWESVHLGTDRLVQQEPAHQVLESYLAARLGFESMLGEPPDHIGLELLFVSALLEAGRVDEARAFYDAHPGRFIARVAAAIAEHAQSDLMVISAAVLGAVDATRWP